MSDRTLVKVFSDGDFIGFKTFSRKWKSSPRFLVSRHELDVLERENSVISKDINSFAVLRRNTADGTLSVEFSWLRRRSHDLFGRSEAVTLPYDKLVEFIYASTQEDGPKTWSTLSLERTAEPEIIFNDTAGLRKCLENRIVRKKLSHALRDCFCGYERVILYNDFVPYSFFFRTFISGELYISGGLIFHNCGDMSKAYYSIHT